MKRPDWYKHGWSLDIKDQSWTEDTENQVDFVVKALGLEGGERILDLACGYGRHALALARRGFDVVGVDITPVYIEDAKRNAASENLPAAFILSDIRDVAFESEFDAVLNLADGAIGYLENDAENLKIFDVIARALKPGGRHFMDVCRAEYARLYFPTTHWEVGQKALALAQFEWDESTRRMTYAGWDIPYGEPARKPNIVMEDTPDGRLYDLPELEEILRQRGMEAFAAYCDYYGSPATHRELQLMVCSRKTRG
ncbi:MAG: class I SAM-dependent methyltransferase [Oscillospiraceae bacterium]|jgi:SAM-dependent methyltransferase|nr:class I SAM-dependent methyltransferase [Oscillospiraceae bacterium]